MDCFYTLTSKVVEKQCNPKLAASIEIQCQHVILVVLFGIHLGFHYFSIADTV